MKTCPHCNQPLVTIPAGVSKKTGRPYKEFHKCEKCGIIINDSPRTEPKPAYQGSNNEIMNALREIYKLQERTIKKIDVLSNPDPLDVTKEDLADIFPTE